MDSICPRASYPKVTSQNTIFEKCIVQPGTLSLSLQGQDVERLSKIKIAIPSLHSARVQLLLRGRPPTRIDILNLTSVDLNSRIYTNTQGQSFLARARVGLAAPGEEMALLQQTFCTRRDLVEIPSSQKPQTALIVTPEVMSEIQELKSRARDNIINGSFCAATATSNLAASSVNLIFATGQASVSLLQSLISLSSRSDYKMQLASTLAHLAFTGQSLGVTSSRTGWDLATLGYHLAQAAYGLGQYTYAATSKPKPPTLPCPPQIHLVQRKPETAVCDYTQASRLDIQIEGNKVQKESDQINSRATNTKSKEPDSPSGSQLANELGFETIEITQTASQASAHASPNSSVDTAASNLMSAEVESAEVDFPEKQESYYKIKDQMIVTQQWIKNNDNSKPAAYLLNSIIDPTQQ